MPAILVTGASTGIGEACALHLDSLGHTVFAGVRKPEDGERVAAQGSNRLTPLLIDVADGASIDAAVKSIDGLIGAMRFAGVVNNAGVARGGPLEYLAIEEWRDQIEVNVIGQIAVTKGFLPLIRRGCGRIVFVGSISGRIGSPLLGPYCASKFALEGIAESLRHELFEWDIKVALIEPGVVKTAIWGKGRETVERLENDAEPEMTERYAALIKRVRVSMEENDAGGIEPIEVARAIEHALFALRPKPRYLVGPDAKSAAMMAKFVPDRLKDVIVRRLG